METVINWLDLPVEIWELILSNLDAYELLKASETCIKFNNVLSMSQRLMKKLSLEIGNTYLTYLSENKLAKKKVCEDSLSELNLRKEYIQKSDRKYESILIFSLMDHVAEHYIKNVLFDILKQFAGSVKQITLMDISLQDNNKNSFCHTVSVEIISLIVKTLKSLKTLKYDGKNYII